eukprot:6130281-Alexandrium_andersonii.AAC.1
MIGRGLAALGLLLLLLVQLLGLVVLIGLDSRCSLARRLDACSRLLRLLPIHLLLRLALGAIFVLGLRGLAILQA